MRNTYHRMTYPFDVALSRAESFIIGKLRETKWRNVMTGLCLTYASAGVWLIWQAWLTREVDDLVFGVFHTCVGVVYATILALRTSIHTRIDAYAVRALLKQADRDRNNDLMIMEGVPPVTELWNESDEVIERYLNKATDKLQDAGFIPFIDGATEDIRYEQMIGDKAEELYADDKYEQNKGVDNSQR